MECVLQVSIEESKTPAKLTRQLLPGFVSIEECLSIKAFFDGLQLEQVRATDDGRVEFRLPDAFSGKMHFLSIGSAAKRFPKDKRYLSLPVVSFAFSAIEKPDQTIDDRVEGSRSSVEQKELQPV